MGDELLARAPALVGVALAGERERALDGFPVQVLAGLRAVLLDDREQVAEQLALRRTQLLGDLVSGRRGDLAVASNADALALTRGRGRASAPRRALSLRRALAVATAVYLGGALLLG